jgi:hypothetical protein
MAAIGFGLVVIPQDRRVARRRRMNYTFIVPLPSRCPAASVWS